MLLLLLLLLFVGPVLYGLARKTRPGYAGMFPLFVLIACWDAGVVLLAHIFL